MGRSENEGILRLKCDGGRTILIFFSNLALGLRILFCDLAEEKKPIHSFLGVSEKRIGAGEKK